MDHQFLPNRSADTSPDPPTDVTTTTTTTTTHQGQGKSQDQGQPKKVFLVAAFRADRLGVEPQPLTGTAEDVVAVIGMAAGRQRFEWVGENQAESIANPALVTPVKVRLAVPSPWHPRDSNMATGLVQLDPTQLGSGSLDEDVDHLLQALASSRAGSTPSPLPGSGVNFDQSLTA